MYVSSASTIVPLPPILPCCFMRVRICRAMRQAVLYVTPSCRSSSLAATPFLELENKYIAKNQLLSGVDDL